ncbi:Uncharacterized protein HZ326_29420 [Fusarium oxysporum f. sp. albedinis]|nr:Uncharacterized protein HZ326_29420 [Fusarium oxysporum f. sp. albedinis]
MTLRRIWKGLKAITRHLPINHARPATYNYPVLTQFSSISTGLTMTKQKVVVENMPVEIYPMPLAMFTPTQTYRPDCKWQ